MSFSLTTPQFRDRSKTVTRRCGWWFLKPGDVVCGVEKGRGLKKGEKIKRLGMIRIVSARPERLSTIDAADVRREGFPDHTPAQFVAMFCKHNRIEPNHLVNRIEFEYLD
jgi:hypothetical protein